MEENMDLQKPANYLITDFIGLVGCKLVYSMMKQAKPH